MIKCGDGILITHADIKEALEHRIPSVYLQEKLSDLLSDVIMYHYRNKAAEDLRECIEGLRTGKYHLIEADDYIKECNRLRKKCDKHES